MQYSEAVMVTISVIIPSLNDAVLLDQCLSALRSQTRLPDEIVVVDNGSTDNTADVAKSFGARVVEEPVRGIPSATARGFDEATCEVLARLDADSIPDETWIERVHDHFDRNHDLTAVTGTGEFYGSKPWVHRAGERLVLGGYFWFFPLILGHPPLFGSNLAIRKEAWERLEPKFQRTTPRIHDDMHLSMLIESDMHVAFDDELRVGVSARPLVSPRRLVRWVWWAVPTALATSRDAALIGRRRRRRRERSRSNLSRHR